jgi:hypothetical protein
MPFTHAQVPLHNNVKVYIEVESHFANKTFIQANDAGYLTRDLPHLRFQAAEGSPTALGDEKQLQPLAIP